MARLSKTAAKEMSYLVSKWALKYGSRIYGSALQYKGSVEMAIIPNKIGKIMISSGVKQFATGAMSFASTFSLFPQYFEESGNLLSKWKKIINGVTLERDRMSLIKQMSKEIHDCARKWESKIGMQSWIDLLTFFIPIPFVGWTN